MKTNPRFVWLVGAVNEEFPDVPSPDVNPSLYATTCLYDRKLKRVVLRLEPAYSNLFCLEKVNSQPLTDVETWLNALTDSDLASEGMPIQFCS